MKTVFSFAAHFVVLAVAMTSISTEAQVLVSRSFQPFQDIPDWIQADF